MEEQKDLVKNQAIEDHPVDQNIPQADKAVFVDDDDDNVATAEDLEAFIRDRREKEKQKNEKKEKTDVFGEYAAPENSIDPYLEPDPTLPWVKYEEPLFLSRGCRRKPESYVPVNESETRSCCKVTSCNWMCGIRQPGGSTFDCVEVRFKNNRKEFFRLPDGLEVTEGDVVAVEGLPGHDIGIVSLTGEVCRIQMKKRRVDPNGENVRKLFRRAKASDIDRWMESLQNEGSALMKTRRIAQDLHLEMKVNDVEYQGDNSKAIFYYTADDRVDFRQLIKVLADEFHVRIEMKQIGVRQEAGKVGGLGTCGRELCCSTWLTNFKSVTTSAAKTQQILPNPQKLAGQCGKLKCCLNFECDVYADALKKFPPANTPIRFKKGLAMYKKTDVLRGIMWYAYEGENDLYALTAESVKNIIAMNRNQEYPERMEDYQVELMSTAALAQETDNADFERELRRMADDMSDEDVAQDSRNDRHDRQHNDRDRRDRRDRKGHNGDGRQHSSDQQRQRGADQHSRNEHRQHNNDRQRDEQRQHSDEQRVRAADHAVRNSNNRHNNARNNPRRSSNKDKRSSE